MKTGPPSFGEPAERAAQAERDARLVERIAAGEGEAEAELVDRFYRRVHAMMAIRTRDREAARDLAQEALMAALGALRKGQLREAERLAGFVHGIARNVLNNFFRQQRPRGEAVELSPELAWFEPPDEVEEAERLAALRAGLARLEPDDRSILVLTLVEGLKPGQIAARLGLSAEVVRTRKSRALKRLTEHVRERLEGRRPRPPR
jgi:RNA polymerase sigma factor (sigma-70 family)